MDYCFKKLRFKTAAEIIQTRPQRGRIFTNTFGDAVPCIRLFRSRGFVWLWATDIWLLRSRPKIDWPDL